MEYTYLLLHPCANIIIDQVFKLLKVHNFDVVAVYRLKHWDLILDVLYKNTYAMRFSVYKHVQSHIYINKYFFGDTGLILILYKNISYTELIDETISIKINIRNSMSETKNGSILILLEENNNFIKQSIDNLNDNKCNAFQQSANKMRIFLNYLHCPDTIEQYIEDFKSLQKYLINKLSDEEIDDILKFKSFLY